MTVSRVDDYLVEGFEEVDLAEEPGPSNLVGEISEVWEREQV